MTDSFLSRFSALDGLRAGLAVAVAVTVFGLAFTAASSSAAEGSRLGLRGAKRRKLLADSPVWARFEPLVRWTAQRVAGFLPENMRADLDQKLTLAGEYLGLMPSEFVGLTGLSTAGGLCLGLLLGAAMDHTLLAIGCTVVGAALPTIQLANITAERLRRIGRELPHAIDTLALAMSAGKDFTGAVREFVARAHEARVSGTQPSPLTEELEVLLWRMQTGQTRCQALGAFARRVPIEPVQSFTSAVIQAEERGNPLARTLRIQAETSRLRRTVRAEEAASKAAVQMVLPLFMVFGCVMALVLTPLFFQLGEAM